MIHFGGKSVMPTLTRTMTTIFLSAILLIVGGGCSLVFKAREPIVQVPFDSPAPGRPETLFICLPGIFSGPGYFIRKGLVGEIAAKGIDADVIAVDAHSGYYRNQTLFPRLLNDVVIPAKLKGYRRVWLVGVSLGGLGALMYAREHPESIDGVLAIAPYLGGDSFREEIAAAGGLAAWQPKNIEPGDRYQAIWLWLKQRLESDSPHPDIFLGYGTEDRFAPNLDLLAAAMSPDRVITVEGTHRWRTWKRVFSQFLIRVPGKWKASSFGLSDLIPGLNGEAAKIDASSESIERHAIRNCMSRP
jgi:pimeloyl-ACP methyl ester carboxylesterase